MSSKQTYQQEEQIRRYLQDQMTEAERHAFEREMQRDPFLTEAVEGLSLVAPNLVSSDLKELKKRMVKTSQNRRYVWVAAASVLLLIVSSLVLMNLPKDVVPLVAENKIQEEAIPKERKRVIKLENSQPPSTHIPEKNLKKQSVVVSDELVVEDTVMESAVITSMEITETSSQSLMKLTVNPQSSEIETKHADSATKESNSQVFYLAAPKAQDKMAGNRSVKNEAELSEVVVVGYGTQKKSNMTGSVSSNKTKQVLDGKATPAIGWKAFDEYLKTQISAPKIGKPDKKTVVRLSFVITETGEKVQFEILKGEDETYNKEAIRIINDGPVWIAEVKEKTPQKSVVKLKLVFEPK